MREICSACHQPVMKPLSVEGNWRTAIEEEIEHTLTEGPCYIVFETDDGVRYQYVRPGEPVPQRVSYTDDAGELDGALFTTEEFTVHDGHACAPPAAQASPLVKETITRSPKFN